jgi:nucleoside 2-deoxyribosyltransferase
VKNGPQRSAISRTKARPPKPPTLSLTYLAGPRFFAETTTALREAEDEVLRSDIEGVALETRAEDIVRAERAREQSLRFAISELRFVEQQAREEGRGVADLEEQIAELERRLAGVKTALDEQLSALHDAGIALASSRAEAEHVRDIAYGELERVVDAAAPAYAEDADIHASIASVNSFRAMRRGVAPSP